MKHIFLSYLILAFGGSVHAQGVLPLSEIQSTLTWEGKPLVGSGHKGTISFVSGSITMADENQITEGDFIIDMKSIADTDITSPQSAKDLADHLRSDDFFAVDKFPRAYFVIQKISPAMKLTEQERYLVTGLLTMKGVSQVITFPVEISKGNEGIRVKATFTIDRTRWGIIHQSGTILSTMKDSIISDDVKITLDLTFGGC